MISLPLLLSALTGTEAFKPSGRSSSSPVSKPFDQQFADQYSPLKYLGNLGPYSTRQGNGISPETPEGCEVDQVVLLQRHGERYPSISDVKDQKKILQKIYESHPESFSGDLEFLNRWTYFLESEGDAGLEIPSGPYSGLADLFEKGSQFAGKYGYLWDGESSVPLFVTESERVLQSAREFGRGLFGYNYTDIAQVNVISESEAVGANAISPYFCKDNVTTDCKVPKRETRDGIFDLIFPEFDAAAIRLNEEHGLKLTGKDVSVLFEVGAFDVSKRGNSPWLDVFTREEWKAYAYRRGLYFYCYFGGGSKQFRAAGATWANATTQLLNEGPEGSGLPLVLTFSHDSEITSFLGGIGALTPLKPLSTEAVTFDTRWEVDDIIPMGAQLVIERLKCRAPGLTNKTDIVSTDATIPDSLLNATYGSYNASAHGNLTTGYFATNYANSTINSTFVTNSTSYSNLTAIGPYSNTTITVFNTTTSFNGSAPLFNITNSTSFYGFNATNATTDAKPEEDSYFVRVLLNDAVVPLDFCYGGPGHSCSLEKWTDHVVKMAKENSYDKVCHTKENGVASTIEFYWNYNKTTSMDIPSFIPWQGQSIV